MLCLAAAGVPGGRARARPRLGHPRALRPAAARTSCGRGRAATPGRSGPRSACSATSSTTTRATCTPRTGLVLEPGALGVWLVGEAGALLVRPGGRRVDCCCVRVPEPRPAVGRPDRPPAARAARRRGRLRDRRQPRLQRRRLARCGAACAQADAPGARGRRVAIGRADPARMSNPRPRSPGRRPMRARRRAAIMLVMTAITAAQPAALLVPAAPTRAEDRGDARVRRYHLGPAPARVAATSRGPSASRTSSAPTTDRGRDRSVRSRPAGRLSLIMDEHVVHLRRLGKQAIALLVLIAACPRAEGRRRLDHRLRAMIIVVVVVALDRRVLGASASI